MIRIRPTTMSDAAAICNLYRRNGLGELEPGEWRARWEKYPFADQFRGIPPGWVIEDETGLTGSFSSVHMLFELDGRPLRAALGCEWCTDRKSRRVSLALLDSFLEQDGIDIALIGSANPVASNILTKLNVARIPAHDYDRPLFWTARASAFAGTVLRRRRIMCADMMSVPAGIGLRLIDLARGSGRGRIHSRVDRLHTFDDRFDTFWERLRCGPNRLRAVRSAKALTWRFRPSLETGNAVILASHQDRDLAGYSVLIRRLTDDERENVYEIADLQALDDNTEIFQDLILSSIRIARENGAAWVKLLAGAGPKRNASIALKPHTYQLSMWQLYYKAGTPVLDTRLTAAGVWDFSPFDNY